MTRLNEDNIKYAHVTGDMSIKKRKESVDKYNSNKIKVLLISKAGGEGLDLKGTRHVILMEPAWNDTTQEQVIGRAVRYLSHHHLPEDQRIVDVWKLHLIKPQEEDHLKQYKRELTTNLVGKERLSVDLYLRNFLTKKQLIINNLLRDLKAVSIETRMCRNMF
jgi:superfamily II DNA/RNA helicase